MVKIEASLDMQWQPLRGKKGKNETYPVTRCDGERMKSKQAGFTFVSNKVGSLSSVLQNRHDQIHPLDRSDAPSVLDLD